MALLWCPFCHEVYDTTLRDTCPDCGILLCSPDDVRPPRHSAEERMHAPLPRWSPAGGRGAVVALALVNLTLFFAPWLVIRIPASYAFSGFELTTTRGFWFGGGAVASLVLIPLVVSRRTLAELRGIRAIASLLASVTAWQSLFVIALSGARGSSQVSYEFTAAFFASGVLSGLAAVVALRLGRLGGENRRNAGFE